MVSDWIKWEGGACPVHENTLVYVKFGDGYVSQKGRAKKWLWNHSPVLEANIVAYSLSETQHRTLEEAYEDADRPISDGYVDSALNEQVAGNHYKQLEIQPVQYVNANNLDYFQGNVVKYITRHKLKGKADDVKKAIHYCKLILELQYGEDK